MPQRPDDYYEDSALWQRPPEPYQLQVVADVRQMLPDDVGSVLDVGCGDGLVKLALPSHLQVYGIDGSREALRHAGSGVVRGGVTELPFPDRSFDLVMANDVLEHLDDAALGATIAEMRRVASRHVLVTVPLREQLARSSARCAVCNAVVHVNRHLRSFREADLLALAGDGFVVVELRYSGGVLGPPPDPWAEAMLTESVGLRGMAEPCPHCGALPARDVCVAVEGSAELDAARAASWWGRDPASAVHVDRSEAIVLLSREPVRVARRVVERGMRRTTLDLLEIDCANDLQFVDDWVFGSTLARARLCGSARRDRDRVCSDAVATGWLECCFPCTARRGDVLELSGEELTGCRVFAWDGAIGEEQELTGEIARSARFVLDADPTAGANGQVMNVYLGTATRLRSVRLRGEGIDARVAAFAVEPGHAVATLSSGSIAVTWGFRCAGGGVLPAPRWIDGAAVDRSAGVTAPLLAASAAIRRRGRHRVARLLERFAGIEQQRAAATAALHAAREELRAAERTRDDAIAAQARTTRLLQDCRRVQRVLVCASWFPSDEHPGLGSFVFEQVRALREHAEIDARVVCGRPYWINTFDPRRVLSALRDHRARLFASSWGGRDGVPLFEFPYLAGHAVSWLPTAANYRRALRSVESTLHEGFDYDLVHAHTAYVDGTAALAIARMRGVPCVITEHTGPFSGLMTNALVRRRTLASIRDADRVWAVSRALRDEIAGWLGESDPANLAVLHNGIDTSLFVPSAAATDRGDAVVRLGAVGVFEDVKDPALLLDAFQVYHRARPASSLTLVGDGPLRAAVEARIAELGLSAVVRLTGRLPREEIARMLRDEIDALVVASRTETFGMVVIEAMACGKPVVATRCGGPEDVVTSEEFGVLVDGREPAALAAGMEQVSARLDRFGRDVIRRHVVAHFDLAPLACRLAREYQSIAREHGRGRWPWR
ncbi:MAG: glycosyltransferase [Planctomycetota bacterium]